MEPLVPEPKPHVKISLAIVFVVFAQYGWTLWHPFHFDDSHTIQTNIAIQTPANLLKLWTSASYYSVTPENWGYRPVTTFSNAVAWLAGHGATWPFQLQKKVLHAGVCILLYFMWLELFSVPGFFPAEPPRLRLSLPWFDRTWVIGRAECAAVVAFAFAIHPVNVEVVDYISDTSTLLAGFWFLCAYVLYLEFRKRHSGGAALVACSCLSYAISVLSKEEGITLPAVLLLTAWLAPLPEPRPRRRWLSLLPWVATMLLVAVLLRLMFAESSSWARGTTSRADYFMTQWRAYLRYFRLLVLPYGLNADNVAFGFSARFLDVKVLGALAANLAIVVSAWLGRRRFPGVLFGVLWFYITISPASSIIPLSEPVNDHRMYIGYFGLLGAIVPWLLHGLDRVANRISDDALSEVRPRSGAVVAVVVVALTAATQARNYVWASDERLWADTVAKNPESGRAMNNLALIYMGRADWARAEALISGCERVWPAYWTCKVNQAVIQSALGNDNGAEQKFKEAIAVAPNMTFARYRYGEFLEQRARYAEAIAMYRDVDRLAEGGDLRAKLDWVACARKIGRTAEADAVMAEARARFTGNPLLAPEPAPGATR